MWSYAKHLTGRIFDGFRFRRGVVVLLKENWDGDSKPGDEAETETIPEETDMLTLQIASERPRRLAELNIATRVKPIPNYSSLFVFSPTNRYRRFYSLEFFLAQCTE